MKMIFATRDTKDRPAIHMVESLEPGKAGDAVLIWQGMDWLTAEGNINLDLPLKICAELWSVNVTRDQIAYVKRALGNTNGWTVSDDCRDWQPPTPPAEWVEHERTERWPDEI